MLKLKAGLIALPLAFALVGCTAQAAPEPTEPAVDTRPTFSETVFMNVLESSLTLAPSQAPSQGNILRWNEGDSQYGTSGRFSVTYLEFSSAASVLCYEDEQTQGAFTLKSSTTDFSFYYAVSLEGSCTDFTEDLTFRADLNPEVYGYTVVDTTEDGGAEAYVAELQAFFDESAIQPSA